MDDEALLRQIARQTASYFITFANPVNGLVSDRSESADIASIAATGMGLTCYPIAVENGDMTREHAGGLTNATLRFFAEAPQGDGKASCGRNGFFYHFMDRDTGERALRSEVSTVDTGILFLGALTAGKYFHKENAQEQEIRRLAGKLLASADWEWATDKAGGISHGWTPEKGMIPCAWRGYNEALFLYILAKGSGARVSYEEWTSTYKWKKVYGREYLHGGPLFLHQMTQAWIDMRGIQDAFMREKGSDYFKNSEQATRIQHEYAVRNRRKHEGYGPKLWGITASGGPGRDRHVTGSGARDVFGYKARGVPFGPDDGTVSPAVVAASTPFAPDIVIPTLHDFSTREFLGPSGYRCSINPSYQKHSAQGWVSSDYIGIDQGLAAILINNHLNEQTWALAREDSTVVRGLKACGFQGGWLDN